MNLNWLKAVPLTIIGVFSLVLMFAGYNGVEMVMDTAHPDTLNPPLVQNGQRTAVGNIIQPLLATPAGVGDSPDLAFLYLPGFHRD